MMPSLILLLAFAVCFDFLNGFHDSSNVVATVIASEALPPRTACVIAAICHFTAPLIFPLAVATTLGQGMLVDQSITVNVVIAGLAAAVAWDVITWLIGLPSSSSHALVGGLIGAAVASAGFAVVRLDGLTKILLALFLSPILGLLVGFLIMRLTLAAAQDTTPQVNRVFRSLQIVTLVGLAFGHGPKDVQKTMDAFTMGLVASGMLKTFHVPIWVILVSASAIALGISLGGWRLIKTLGARIYRVRPIHGFASQVAGASVIVGASIMGGPVSTTQVVSSSIMGVGAGERLGKVHWNVLNDMGTAWLLTIPVCGLFAALVFVIFFRV